MDSNIIFDSLRLRLEMILDSIKMEQIDLRNFLHDLQRDDGLTIAQKLDHINGMNYVTSELRGEHNVVYWLITNVPGFEDISQKHDELKIEFKNIQNKIKEYKNQLKNIINKEGEQHEHSPSAQK